MFIPGYGSDPNARPGLAPLQFFDTNSEDKGHAERSTAVLRRVREAYPLPRHLTAADEKRAAAKLQSLRELKSGWNLLQIREAMGPDLFDIYLRRTVHIKVLDGQGSAAFTDWRNLADIVPVPDFEAQESMRFEDPGDLLKRVVSSGPVDFEAIDEFEMPSYRAAHYSRGFELNMETMTIQGLGDNLIRRFTDGVNFNRTVERFVFKNLLEDNPTLTVDGVSQLLFGDGAVHTTGGSNDLNVAVTPLDITQLENILALMSEQTRDGNEMAINPRWIIVKTNSINHVRAREILGSEIRPELGATTSTPSAVNVMGRDFTLGVISSPVLNANSWFVSSDTQLNPELAMELGFFNGQDSPQVIDVDRSVSSYFNLNQKNRWVVRSQFGGTYRDFRGIYRGSPKA